MNFESGGERTGAVFDPDLLRAFSVLPDQDMDEAYCVRHDREMLEFEVVAFFCGAEYELADDFHAVTCEACASEVVTQRTPGLKPVEMLRYHGGKAFHKWNDGEAPGNWFQFVQEREDAPDDPDDLRVNILHTEGADD